MSGYWKSSGQLRYFPLSILIRKTWCKQCNSNHHKTQHQSHQQKSKFSSMFAICAMCSHGNTSNSISAALSDLMQLGLLSQPRKTEKDRLPILVSSLRAVTRMQKNKRMALGCEAADGRVLQKRMEKQRQGGAESCMQGFGFDGDKPPTHPPPSLPLLLP